jgi:multiphosphoryl transfer protein
MTEKRLQGSGASAGIVTGPAFRFEPARLYPPRRPFTTVDSEMRRFSVARQQARTELEDLQRRLSVRLKQTELEIFAAHAVLISDPMLEEAVRAAVENEEIAEAAVLSASELLAETMRSSGDSYFASRAADIQDIGRRLLRVMLGREDTSLQSLTRPVIITARDLAPSDTASLVPEMTLGICLAEGSPTSHAVILARSLGIACVIGLGSDLMRIPNGAQLALDGSAGEVVVDPEPTTLAHYRAARRRHQERVTQTNLRVFQDAQTTDGQRILVYANIGDLESTRRAVSLGAEGIGLFRTEFMFLDADQPPDEDTQVAAYRAVFEVLEGRPITVRTLDVGGDKPPAYIPFPHEDNPFLGLRGVRVSLENPELFKTQLKAIMRAAVGFEVQIMYPMVESLSTLRHAQRLAGEARTELRESGSYFAAEIPIGIMVETPSAVIMADRLVQECDFFSLGTNDLTQYTLAVDRGASHIRHYFRDLSPPILRMIQQTLNIAHRASRTVSICGELASKPTAIPILLGLGLQQLSVAPTLVPQTKWIVNHFAAFEAQRIAAIALTLPTADDIESFVSEELYKRELI